MPPVCSSPRCFLLIAEVVVVGRKEGEGAPGISQESRERDVGNLDLLLHPPIVSPHSPSQARTHHIGHIRRCSALQQGLNNGQVPHEGSHVQRGQAGLRREGGQDS